VLGTGTYAVFVDANVWFSRTLRDWFGMLYTTPDSPPFVAHWTEDVLAEVIHHLRKEHQYWPGSRIAAIRDQMAGTFEAGRVTDFSVDASYLGRDAGDAHVHAAALACQADVLVTFNVRDFAWDANTSRYEVMHPDDFLVLLDDGDPTLVAEVTSAMCDYWVARSGEADVVQRLLTARCPAFAERVRAHLHRMM
jgi:predicted nucleic acid-binding protein